MLGKRYCGDALPPVFTSSSNLMWVRYATDGASNNTQFKATYSREQACKLTHFSDGDDDGGGGDGDDGDGGGD